ncbi:hypothetical protein [Nocardia seriolae]|nr:hypothetical protein [Nocardia seriolae]MTJ72249.1 hypothetical protein [Nocardia seriolae]MTJ88348.1 hypothetical protein [Nocardia seriolae]MTK41674.1 hypothetical protein [Nocardia seriolae]BAW07301.1 conserved hypothetical protein [Nocardia seriolae]
MAEYAQLLDLVKGFDQRLLTVKGWGVTLSLASLGLGFQQKHYGLFLVAAASGLAFWLLEAYNKSHQIRYYPRMRDIEVVAHRLFAVDVPGGGPASSPLIDWGWRAAGARIRRGGKPVDPAVPEPWEDASGGGRSMQPWFFAHAMFPHVIAVVLGGVLFVLGLAGVFGPI